MTADPLKSVPEEPPLPASDPVRRGSKLDAPAWYESQDLQVLKAWDNDIVEIQHEISFFGSLKTIDVSVPVDYLPKLDLMLGDSFTKTKLLFYRAHSGT